MNIIPVYDVPVVPHSSAFFSIDDLSKALGRKPEVGDELTVIMLREPTKRSEITPESIYPIGVTGTVSEIAPFGFAVVSTAGRVDVTDAQSGSGQSGRRLELRFSDRPDVQDMDAELQATRLEQIKTDAREFVSGMQWAPVANRYIARWGSAGDALGMMSTMLTASNEELYGVLAEDSVSRRWEKAEKLIYEALEIARMSSESQSEQENDIRERYREGAIKKQMEYLQGQLDEMHPESVSDVRKFEKKIEDSAMNNEARAEATKVLNRMKQEGKDSPEYGMLYNYLDFVTSLAWDAPESRQIDLDEAQRILDEDHFGLDKVKRRIIQQIAVMDLNHRQSGSILLFVGAPGTGKTSIGQSIARALGREYVRVSLGGSRDEADIRGHRRTYVGAMPGRIMDGIQKSGVSNPVMVLDEIDKLSASYAGDPASALLEVLDPEQNSTFTDHYMNVPYDLSNVLFICTANTLDSIPEPLLDRMEVIRFTGYTPTEKFQIARRHLIPKAMEAAGIGEDALEVTDEALSTIISDYTMEGGVRGLKKRIDELCRIAAVDIVRMGADARVQVTADNLRERLDAHPVHHELVLSAGRPGVVCGLAWTAAGGEILHIESAFTRGSGRLIITGKLGDVMKESVQIAVSLVKESYPEAAELFEKNDLHVHVPAGAVPKDGPSAGVTLTTAIASLVTGRAVDPDLAMTGEVSLRGAVLPIGGLPEKLLAAQRAGVRRVLIPADNVEDLGEVAQEVRDGLEIIPVSTVDEVLMHAGVWTGGASVPEPGSTQRAGASALEGSPAQALDSSVGGNPGERDAAGGAALAR
ncbi:MAG: endopeptidase La [Coriobacteriales bacterium]|jgi:ATP-dependent Lon protease